MYKFKVWSLDMWGDGEGGWTQNDQFEVGTIEVPKVTYSSLIDALYDGKFLRTKDMRRVYVDDDCAFEGCYDIVARKDNEPLFSLWEVV